MKDNTSSRVRKKLFGILIALCVFALIIFVRILIPGKDPIKAKNLPDSLNIAAETNQCDFQTGKDCSGYATAYVLRQMGYTEAYGPIVYQGFKKFFGMVALHNIVDGLEDYGIQATAYHGNLNTLKARLNQGNPVIALITFRLGTETGLHYVAIVGYDEEYIYMADSTRAITNIYGVKQYNRKVTHEEFLELWKTDIYPMDNLYIVCE